jgi:GNAT superfamily N-acetyltransferase
VQLKIQCLPDNQKVMLTLAHWMFDEWGEETSTSSPEAFMPGLRQRADCGSIPFTIVAFHRSEPVGTASVFFQDMDTHKHFSPWLAAVYVAPKFRHREIGRRLCADAVDRAHSLKVEALYLWTPDKPNFYRHMEWELIERARYRNKTVSIMRFWLNRRVD